MFIHPMHITALVFINHDESGVQQGQDRWLEKLAPHEPLSQYRQNDTGKDNADAHIKRQIKMGREVVVAVTEGRLDFRTWEQIFYGEFHGRRRKRVLVRALGSERSCNGEPNQQTGVRAGRFVRVPRMRSQLTTKGLCVPCCTGAFWMHQLWEQEPEGRIFAYIWRPLA